MEHYLAAHLAGYPAGIDSIDAVSVRREQGCNLDSVNDSVGRYDAAEYAIEIDVQGMPRLVTVRLDPITLAGPVAEVHRGAWFQPEAQAPLLCPTDIPDSAIRTGRCR